MSVTACFVFSFRYSGGVGEGEAVAGGTAEAEGETLGDAADGNELETADGFVAPLEHAANRKRMANRAACLIASEVCQS
jgi:hypothetical protein